METFKGTPNGWKVRNERRENIQYINGGVNHIIFKADIQAELTNRHIVEIRGAVQFENELLANAKLIAGSPDLLDACIKLIRHHERKGELLSFNVDIIRQAIIKATT